MAPSIAKTLKKIGWILLASIAAQLLFLALFGIFPNATSADVAVVLGNKIELDGQPHERLAARLEKALEIWEQGKVQHIIVSGGIGKEGFNEAVVMSQWLVDRGVPPNAITADSLGITTRATAQQARELMTQNGWNSAIAISQYWYLFRCELAFKQAGILTVYSEAPSYYTLRDFYSILRELAGTYWYLIQEKQKQ